MRSTLPPLLNPFLSYLFPILPLSFIDFTILVFSNFLFLCRILKLFPNSVLTWREMSSHVHPISRKRKERDLTAAVTAAKVEPPAGSSSSAGNQLLAGYLAHEFLTKGTLFGKQWPPERPEPTGGSATSAQPGPVEEDRARSTGTAKAYDEVAYLLKMDGVHIPGVVNPTQLGRWLQK
ncbi:uncharacterized protein LOC110115570 [Dendrobium catenatum]|uniref:Embryo sac development arrest 6 n=1 Tax=Dendrobium catenatum TaxID=906689 RepID=A0A2I0VNL5_9ASPA|nr:uncharacterized protein LOC110115570 [Dendrobium catenatum]PKU65000.1 hypothetical protein MA16_Dca004615 [Dendrobium catenatum]